MRLIHLSDLHITDCGKPIWDTNVVSHFEMMLDKIKQVKDVDAIIVTGDISNDGSPWSYDYVFKSFDALGVPVLCCPGNHDSLPSFHSGSTNRSVHIGGWKVILLNSVMKDEDDPNKNRASGYIYPEAIAWLREELKEQIPTCIALHHPTLDPGGWFNRKLLINRDEFNALIQNFEHVKLVMYGHIHYHTCERIGQPRERVYPHKTQSTMG